MNSQNIPLTTFDFNEQVSGVNNFYRCWSKDVKTAKSELTNGKNLICLASVVYPKENQLIRDYIYIGFHKTSEDFFSIDFSGYLIRYFFFIPVEDFTEEQINNIILDIKNKHLNHGINDPKIKLSS